MRTVKEERRRTREEGRGKRDALMRMVRDKRREKICENNTEYNVETTQSNVKGGMSVVDMTRCVMRCFTGNLESDLSVS